MTATYDLIASNVLSSSAASVTFSSIPATYRDLVLVVSGARTSSTGFGIRIRFNADSGTNYSQVIMRGNGSTSTSNSSTEPYIYFDAWTTGAFGTGQSNAIFQIMDYSATDKHKTVLQRVNNSALLTSAQAARWASTSAINEIYVEGSDWASGTSFYLYGIVS